MHRVHGLSNSGDIGIMEVREDLTRNSCISPCNWIYTSTIAQSQFLESLQIHMLQLHGKAGFRTLEPQRFPENDASRLALPKMLQKT